MESSHLFQRYRRAWYLKDAERNHFVGRQRVRDIDQGRYTISSLAISLIVYWIWCVSDLISAIRFEDRPIVRGNNDNLFRKWQNSKTYINIFLSLFAMEKDKTRWKFRITQSKIFEDCFPSEIVVFIFRCISLRVLDISSPFDVIIILILTVVVRPYLSYCIKVSWRLLSTWQFFFSFLYFDHCQSSSLLALDLTMNMTLTFSFLFNFRFERNTSQM